MFSTISNGASSIVSATTWPSVSVASARQQVVASQTNVSRAQIDINAAQRELKRATDMIESGVSSRAEYDAAKDRYDQAKIALETAKANLEVTKKAVDEAVARRDQQKEAVKSAQIQVKSSEMRANQHWHMNQVGFLDDDPAKAHRWIAGVPVRGTIDDLERVLRRYSVDEVVLSSPAINGNVEHRIKEVCARLERPVRRLDMKIT